MATAIAIDRTIEYSSNRIAFGSKLIELPAYRARLDAMEKALNSSRHITYMAALLKDMSSNDRDCAGPAAVAKVNASETAGTIANESIEMCGAHGIFGGELNRARDDTDICRIGEGANGMLIAEVIPSLADEKWKGYLARQETLNRSMKPQLQDHSYEELL